MRSQSKSAASWSLVWFALIFMLFPAYRANAVVGETVAAVVVVDRILGGIDDKIKQAKEAGDDFLVQVLIGLKGAIANWKNANLEILQEGFDKLDAESRRSFARAEEVVSSLVIGLNKSTEDVLESSELINLAAGNLLGRKATYILRYFPQVFISGASKEYLLTVRGVNLDLGTPALMLPGWSISGNCSGALECVFAIPAEALGAFSDRQRLMTIDLAYSTRARGLSGMMGRREQVTRSLTFSLLPNSVGSYEFVSSRTIDRRIEETYAVEDNFHASNERHYRTFPPKYGYEWDLNKGFSFERIKDEKGRCEGIVPHESTPFGIRVFAHCDCRRKLGFCYEDGWATCRLTGTVVRTEKQIEAQGPIAGGIDWFNDTVIRFDRGPQEIELEVKAFDGRTLNYSGIGSDRFFTIKQHGDRLVIHPQVPTKLFLDSEPRTGSGSPVRSFPVSAALTATTDQITTGIENLKPATD